MTFKCPVCGNWTNNRKKAVDAANNKLAEPIETVVVSIYGRFEECRVLKQHDFGTIDVERLSDGKCFRVSGLRIQPLLPRKSQRG